MVEHARPGGGEQRSTFHGSGEVRMSWGQVIIHYFSLSLLHMTYLEMNIEVAWMETVAWRR
jgi:hypothetical protein